MLDCYNVQHILWLKYIAEKLWLHEYLLLEMLFFYLHEVHRKHVYVHMRVRLEDSSDSTYPHYNLCTSAMLLN